MNKGLNALEEIKHQFGCDPSYYGLDEQFEVIEKTLKGLEVIKKHFNVCLSVETDHKGKVWGRLVSIQAKEDKGTWDTTACANLALYKEDFKILKEVFKNE